MGEEVKLREEILTRIRSFKNVFDELMEEEMPFSEFVNVVISIGLDKMFRDAIPEGLEWSTIEKIFKEKPEFICNLVKETYRRGKEITEEQKKKARQTFMPYIG